MRKYLIKEIFGPTLQGEGSRAGSAVKFVRFSACNRWSGNEGDRSKSVCWFCDTDFRGGERLTADEVLARLDTLGDSKTVVISGGEATLQLDFAFLETLQRGGYRMHLETNGSREISDIEHYFEHITVSPKQSLTDTRITFAHDLKLLYPMVIDGVTPEYFESFPALNYFIQPVDGPDQSKNVALAVRYCLAHPKWRLSLQTHKILGVQ